jgi:hypothetical protein
MEKNDQIKETFKLMNFVDFEVEVEEFRNKYCEIFGENLNSPDEIQFAKLDVTFRLLNYIYSGNWDIKDAELGKSLNRSTKQAFGLATIEIEEKIIEEKIKQAFELENTDSINLDDLGNQAVQLAEKIIAELHNEKSNTEEDLSNNEQINNLIGNLKRNWQIIFDAHNKYIEELLKNEVKSVIIYEAPPYQKSGTELNYLLCNNAYGPYFNAIQQLDETGVNNIVDILIDKGILLFDLLMLPIPISSSLRKKWATQKNFQIDGNPLPVFLFQMNIEYFEHKFKKVNYLQDKTFAIGAPQLTSLPIHNYYSINRTAYPSLVRTNNIETRNIKELKRKVLPLFKSSFVNSSNNPDGDLLKLALGYFD